MRWWWKALSPVVVVLSLLGAFALSDSDSVAVARLGLLLDVWGATLVVLPLMRRTGEIREVARPDNPMALAHMDGKNEMAPNRRVVAALERDRGQGAVGLAFLSMGFLLQLAATSA